MSEIASQKVAITTTGAAGSATGSGTTIPIMGFLLDLYIDYNASAPATTDITISEDTFGTIFTKSNANTDAWHAPRKQAVDTSAADAGQYDLIPINGELTISVAQSDALDPAVTVTVRWLTP